MSVSIYIENEKLDLFKDETIEITSSVTNVNDITKNTIDFSKNFTVPATTTNNKIFKHWYNQNIINAFDARTRTNGRIEISGVVFKYGRFSLQDVKLKQNKPTNYSLIFYGNGISLVDKLGNDELSSLDLSQFNHSFSDRNVYMGLTNNDINGAQGVLFDDKIIYSLITKKRYYFNSSQIDDGVQSLNNHSNIAPFNNWANGIDYKDLRPSIQLIELIKAIEVKYNIKFSRNFFGRKEFTSLYMWANNESFKPTNFTTRAKGLIRVNVNTIAKEFGDDWFRTTGNFDVGVRITFFTPAPENTKKYIAILTADGVEVFRTVKTNNDLTAIIDITLENYKYYRIDIISSDVNISKIEVNFNYNPSAFPTTAEFRNIPNPSIGSIINVKDLLPKLKIIDFLKGLFQMFKLVVEQEKDTDEIYINDLNSYYAEAELYDITEYISTTNYEVEKGNLLSEIKYSFQEPSTILANQFKKNNGIAYGDSELILTEDGTPNSPKLEGGKEEIKLPFEQILYERLVDKASLFNTELIYGAIINEEYNSVNTKPIIHYFDVAYEVSATAVTLLQQRINLFGFYKTPTNTMSSISLIFDEEFNIFDNSLITNTLYKNYHEYYVTSIFNSKRRNFKFEAKLPLRIILKLKLNDVLKINENYYRTNSWTYNLLNGKCKLDLINSFDNTIKGFNADRTIINTDFNAKTESIYVTNFVNIIFDYSASWTINVYNTGNNIYFEIEENLTGFDRSTLVKLINTDTLAEIDITIKQSKNILNFGNEIITFGNNILTFE